MKLSDEELLQELQDRFAEQKNLIATQKKLLGDLENVNKKLIKSERLKSDFLSNIKNEINNPITSMLGLLKVIIKDPKTERSENLTKLIYKEAYTLNFHLQNVFFAAEIEAGQIVPNNTNVDVNKVVIDQLNSLNEVYQEKDISVDFDSKIKDSFTVDRTYLDIIVANLISNAIKFSHDGGRIRIHLSLTETNALRIVIEDFGMGMEPSSIKRAFDRFVQLDAGTTKQFGGHGLGLSVVQSLLEFMDAQIQVDSEPDQGTRIEVVIPEGDQNNEDDLFDEDDEFLFSDDDNVKVF